MEGRRSIRCDGAVLSALHLPGKGLSSHLCGPERNQQTRCPGTVGIHGRLAYPTLCKARGVPANATFGNNLDDLNKFPGIAKET